MKEKHNIPGALREMMPKEKAELIQELCEEMQRSDLINQHKFITECAIEGNVFTMEQFKEHIQYAVKHEMFERAEGIRLALEKYKKE